MYAEQTVLSACIEFCHQTLLIQDLTTMKVEAGVQDYTIDVPSNMVLIKVLGVIHVDKWLTPNSVENVRSGLALRGSVGDAVVAEAAPKVYFQKWPNSPDISLYPVPAETVIEGLAIRAAYAPTRSAAVVDDVLFDSWAEAIAAGAISRLLQMPSQTFSAPQLAVIYRGQFDTATRKASILARSGRVAASSRVQLSRFA